MNQRDTEHWTGIFKQHGYLNPIQIGAGMEGVIYLLKPNELVAKVWGHSNIEQLKTLSDFYSQLASHAGDIQTPEIFKVELIENHVVSFEKFLAGYTLQSKLNSNNKRPDDRAVLATLNVLVFLKSIPAKETFTQLNVIGHEENPWQHAKGWESAINHLVSNRATQYQHLLKQDVKSLNHLIKQIQQFIATRVDAEISLLHGDLFGENILVDEYLKPTAVLDFGFLSMPGDSAFDIAITTSIFDMFGPHATEIDRDLTQTFAKHFEFNVETLLAYKAIYAIISSNAYSQSRNDGHYQWCIELLNRSDIRSALGN